MVLTPETIIDSSSPIREQWLPLEMAVRQVVAFERRFGSKHLFLASHAALPFIVTPELLNLIHLNFLENEHIPWVAEVDFLLSPLCRPVENRLFEVEPSVREVLLVELEEQFGRQRLREISEFVLYFLGNNQGLNQHLDILQTQRWIALSYIDPNLVVKEMTDILQKSLSSKTSQPSSLTGQMQIAHTLELITEPLERASLHTEYQYLVHDSHVLEQMLYGYEAMKHSAAQVLSSAENRERMTTLLSPRMLEWLTVVAKTSNTPPEQSTIPGQQIKSKSIGDTTTSREETSSDRRADKQVQTTLPKILLDKCQSYMTTRDLELVQHAYELAMQAPIVVEQFSLDKPYFGPLARAMILADMHIDALGVAAAMLYDMVEFTPLTLDEIRLQLGPAIASIVDGVTKFDAFVAKKDYRVARDQQRRVRDSEIKQQAEAVRKLLLAMAVGPRVVVVKLADQLQKMRTLDKMNQVQQQNRAHETREIYAPLAGQLGLWVLKAELEDLAFKYLEPNKYQWLEEKVSEKPEERKGYVDRVCQIVREEMKLAGINADISGRPKHLYSIYLKMERLKAEDISEIEDLMAFRILVDTVDDCYRAQGHLHMLWRPLEGRIEDYIGQPGKNGYQSLHTTVFCLDNRLAEFEIRTHEMHRAAEMSLASHWDDDEDDGSAPPSNAVLAWNEQLWEWRNELSQGTSELDDTVKDDLFKDQIFVFTPKGDVIELPYGSTPLDFAYRIDRALGNHYSGARVIMDTEQQIVRLVPLDYRLKNGEIVDIITSKNAHPTHDWSSIAKSQYAREQILNYLNTIERDIDIQRGQEQLQQELAGLSGRTFILTKDVKDWLVAASQYWLIDDEYWYGNWEDLLVAIARDKERLHTVAARLLEHLDELQKAHETAADREARVAAEDSAVLDSLRATVPEETPRSTGVSVGGVSGLFAKIANCCCPLPGDPIIGYVSRRSEVVIHRFDCKNLRRYIENYGERLIEVSWSVMPQQRYRVPIMIIAQDRPGLMRDVAAALGEMGINMVAVRATTIPSANKAHITATLEIESLEQLDRIFTRLKRMRSVVKVERALG